MQIAWLVHGQTVALHMDARYIRLSYHFLRGMRYQYPPSCKATIELVYSSLYQSTLLEDLNFPRVDLVLA
jgi:hypothetical protein